MLVSPKKKGSPLLWIACFLLLFDVRVFFGVMAASEKFDPATKFDELPLELQSFVNFTGDGNITVAINGSGTPTNISLIAVSSSALSFRASSKGCVGEEQKWNFTYPMGNVTKSLNLTWNRKEAEIFKLGEALDLAQRTESVDVFLERSEVKVKNENRKEQDTVNGVKPIDTVNAPPLPENKYNMSISVNHTTGGDGCVLTLEFDKEKFKLAKMTTATSIAVPAIPSPTSSSGKAGLLWFLLIPVVVLLLGVMSVGIFCYMKRRRNQRSPADHLERGDEVTCVSKTVRPTEKAGTKELVKTAVAKEEGVKGNKSDAIAAITGSRQQKKAPESEQIESMNPVTPDVKTPVLLALEKTQEDPVERAAIKKTKNPFDRLVDVNSDLADLSPKKQTPPTVFEENKQNSDYTKSTQDTLQLSK